MVVPSWVSCPAHARAFYVLKAEIPKLVCRNRSTWPLIDDPDAKLD